MDLQSLIEKVLNETATTGEAKETLLLVIQRTKHLENLVEMWQSAMNLQEQAVVTYKKQITELEKELLNKAK